MLAVLIIAPFALLVGVYLLAWKARASVEGIWC
jgi:hypothetical protein